MNDSLSILLATTILGIGGLGLYVYKSSFDENISEEDYNKKNKKKIHWDGGEHDDEHDDESNKSYDSDENDSEDDGSDKSSEDDGSEEDVFDDDEVNQKKPKPKPKTITKKNKKS